MTCDRTAPNCPRYPAECDGWQFDEESNTTRNCRTQHDFAKRQEMENKLKSARITPRFLTRTLANYTPTNASQKAAIHAAKLYCDSFGPETMNGVGFLGPVGTGKTHIMAGMVNALMGKGVECIYASIADLSGEMKQGAKDGSIEELLDRICSVRFLALDDLGAEKDSPFLEEVRYRIINSRYEGLAPTCFTTNLSRGDLASRYGARVESRLYEMAQWLIVAGDDYRKRG